MYLAPIVPSTSPAVDVMKILKINIDPAKEKLTQLDIRKTRNGVTVLTNDADTFNNLQTALRNNVSTSTALSVKIQKKRKPRIRIVGVDHDIPGSNIINEINSRNEAVKLDGTHCRHIVAYKERSGNTTHILEVDPAARRRLLDKGTLAIGWTLARIEEDFHVPLCTFCATYGHSRRGCLFTGQPDKIVCTKCASNHLPEQCVVRAGDEAVTCNEWRRVGLPSTHPTGHMDCPVLQDRIARLKARTDYG